MNVDSKLLDESGKRITYHEEDGKIVLHYHTPDISSVLKVNHEERVAKSRVAPKGDMHRVFRVPEAICLEIRFKYGVDFLNPAQSKDFMAILKRPEYAKFRTYDGAI